VPAVLRRVRNALVWVVGLFLATTIGAVLLMRWIPPVSSAFIVGSYLSAWSQGDWRWYAEHRWTPYERISRSAKLAVIASEDQRFMLHSGFDFQAIDKAIQEREQGRRLRGASTITQQVAKNLFLWPGQSYVRKGLEAYLTVVIEACWPKRRILEVYLNVAEFGTGVYGVGAAAPKFFHSDPARLTPGQAAMLAAVLPSPRHLRIERPSGYLLRRQAAIVAQMELIGGSEFARGIDPPRR
jgi:monofunctional biosynthetic peptidoglycan transglycosylase